MNLNDDGQEIKIDIEHSSIKSESGHVYLYKCNITTLCREVVLADGLGLPLVIQGPADDAVFTFSTDRNEVFIYQITLVPKEKFHINHIKMAPHCIVKNKK